MIQKNSSLLTRRRRRNKSPNTSSFYYFHLPNLKLPHSDIQGRGFFSRRFPSTTLLWTTSLPNNSLRWLPSTIDESSIPRKLLSPPPSPASAPPNVIATAVCRRWDQLIPLSPSLSLSHTSSLLVGDNAERAADDNGVFVGTRARARR